MNQLSFVALLWIGMRSFSIELCAEENQEMKSFESEFVRPSDPILIQPSNEVSIDEISSDKVQSDIERMLRIARGNQQDPTKTVLVGLAAPQVGISKRIILVDVGANGKGQVADLHIYINPEIVWMSEEKEEWYEGCFSTDRVFGIVMRPRKIQVRAWTREAREVIEEHEGYVARIFQHEIDHLNGHEFTEHIIDDNNLHWVEEGEIVSYRNQQQWRHWDNKCSREKWLSIKRGDARFQ